MQNVCLMLVRFLLAGWSCAAALFVVTSVREAKRFADLEDSTIIDLLVLLRFPAYYGFGFAMVAAALLCAILSRNHPASTRRRMKAVVLLTASALCLMAVDYVFIYRDLRRMITPPGIERPTQFDRYHLYSKWINEVDVGLCLTAAVVASMPLGRRDGVEDGCLHRVTRHP